MNEKNRRDDEDMQVVLNSKNAKKQSRQDKVKASFEKLVRANGKALERLSKY